MNDTTNATGPTSAPQGARRPPLRRPRDGRVLAGVSAGIADHLGIDVAIVRLLIVVGTFLTGGFGVIVYVIAIFVIPAADEHEEHQLQAARARRSSSGGLGAQDTGFWVGVGLLVIGVLWLFGGVLGPMSVLPFFRPDLIWPLVLIGFGLALWRASDRRVAPPGSGSPQPSRGPTAFGQPPHASLVAPPSVRDERSSEPDTSSTAPRVGEQRPSTETAPSPSTPPPPPPSPPVAPGETQERETTVTTQQTAQLQAGTPAAREDIGAAPGWEEPYGAGAPYDSAGARPPSPPATGQRAGGGDEWTPPEPRKGSLLTRLTLGAILVTVGVLWMLRMAEVITIGTSRIIAAALLVAGLGLIVGTWFGRGRWLILIGGLLLPVVILAELMRPYGIIDLPEATVRGGFGEIVVAPDDLLDLEARYQLAAGSIRLDLRNLEFDEPTDLVVGVGAGEVVIMLPADVTADVTARVGVGEHRIDDRTSSGFGVPSRRQQIETGDGSELLTIDASVGFGEVQINVIRVIDPVDDPAIDMDADDEAEVSSAPGWGEERLTDLAAVPVSDPASHRELVQVG